MAPSATKLAMFRLLLLGCMTLMAPACVSPGQRARLLTENQTLRDQNTRLERTVAQRESSIAQLHRQIENLKGFPPDRPADLFAPVSIEIATLSGGADYDGQPGDDGVTVYLRPRDADGDAVKAPGRITIQLLDNANLTSPRMLGVYVFDTPLKLRELWHGRFASDHYSLKCPFAPGLDRSGIQRITVSAEFVDFLTGATLTAVKEVSVTPAEAIGAAADP